MIKIKICGVTNSQDALWAANLGADFVGLNFYAQSPRKVSPKNAGEIVKQLPPFVTCVGLFVNESAASIGKIVKSSGVKAVQLHGDETPEFCMAIKALGVKIIKAFRLQTPLDVSMLAAYEPAVDWYLFDYFSPDQVGGTGQTIDPSWLGDTSLIKKPWFLAGGLKPDNIESILKQLKPPMVDVCSGVERSPTRKDYDAMKLFIQKTRSVR